MTPGQGADLIEPAVAAARKLGVTARFFLSLTAGVLTSLPWLGHMRPGSMFKHADRAFASSVGMHTFALLALLTSLRRYGRGVEGVIAIIWIFSFWVTFPNF